MFSIGLLTGRPCTLFCDLAVGNTAIEFVVLDAEGTDLGPRECGEAVRRLQNGRVEVHVRVPSIEPDVLIQYANTGVDELLLPQIRSTAELARAFDAVTYPPKGQRPRQIVRSSAYGLDWNRGPRIGALIETADAFDAAEEFARTAILSTLWIGATDLADDMARQGRSFGGSDEEMNDLLARVRGTCSIGLPAANADGVTRARLLNVQRCAVYWERLAAGAIAGLAVSANPELQTGP